MGTNYYAVMGEEEMVCPHCDRPGHVETIRWHIGKSSGGWCFALHVGSEDEPHIPRSLAGWIEVFERCVRIEDEYGRGVSTAEMLAVITERQRWSNGGVKDDHWFEENYAERGPNGLARASMYRHSGCIAHGEGTYDLITGRFS